MGTSAPLVAASCLKKTCRAFGGKTSFFSWGLAALAAFGVATSADAAVLLTVDISDPSQVKITSTGAAADVNDSVFFSGQGVTLLGVLQSEFSGPPFGPNRVLLGAGLFPAGSSSSDPSQAYVAYIPVNYAAGLDNTGRDINLFSGYAGVIFQTFSTSSPAFSGEAVAILTGVIFQSIGSTGNIVTGSGGIAGEGTVIGQWQVIPEPSTYVLLAAGLLLPWCYRWKSLRGFSQS